MQSRLAGQDIVETPRALAPNSESALVAPAGRPYGSATAVAATHRTLRHAHFTFVRFVLEGMDLRDAWERCLAFAGGLDDERHFARRLREICALIRAGARAHGAERLAQLAVAELVRRRFEAPRTAAPQAPQGQGTDPAPGAADVDPSAARPSAPAPAAESTAAAAAIPTLDEWIETRCAEYGIDVDFQPYGDWLVEYEAEFQDELAAAADGYARGVKGPQAGGPPEAGSRHLDPDMHGQAKRQVLRSEALAELDAAPLAHGALQGRAEPGGADDVQTSRNAQIAALNTLATLLAVPATLDDAVATWCSEAVAGHLRAVGVVTLKNLADFIDVTGFRWHRKVDGLGAVRAARLVAWLVPLLEELRRPLREGSVRAPHQLAIARAQRMATLDPGRLQRFGVVPLERLAVLPEIDGRHGVFRVKGPNTFGVDDDLAAIKSWLRRYEATPRTHRAYLHATDVFYLWCVCGQRKPLSSLVEADLHAFRAFLAAPPPDWISARGVDRASDDWRPLRGPLSTASQRHLITVIGALFTGLLEAGYVSVQVVSGIKRQMKLQRPSVNVRRTFTEPQWRSLKATLAQSPDTPATRRLQLVLELAATTGLRLSEICTARLGQLRRETVPSPDATAPSQVVWMLSLVGKGGKPREVLVFDDVTALIDRHHADLPPLEAMFDPDVPVRSLDPNEGLTPGATSAGHVAPVFSVALVNAAARELASADVVAAPIADPRLRPIVSALRRPVPRWTRDDNGVAVLDRQVARGDAYGALDPSALYQSIKRLFARAAAVHDESVMQQALPFDGATFARASTHWLRHFFATSAADDGIDPFVLQGQMGHASIETTMLYVHPERRALVAQMAKFRRRG